MKKKLPRHPVLFPIFSSLKYKRILNFRSMSCCLYISISRMIRYQYTALILYNGIFSFFFHGKKYFILGYHCMYSELTIHQNIDFKLQ